MEGAEMGRAEVAEAIIAEMKARMHRSTEAKHKFICHYDLKEVLLAHSNHIFAFEKDWRPHEKANLLDQCCQVLGLLIRIGAFTSLPGIRSIFFKRAGTLHRDPVITDEHLPITDESQLEFLPTAKLREDFLDHQYIIKPYTFKEQYPSKTLVVPSDARLPFIKEETGIGIGGYGYVSKVLVAKRYFFGYVGNKHRTFDDDEHCALKQIPTDNAFLEEVKQLEVFKESLTNHSHILTHYVSFTHGNTFNILLPLAEYGDLEVFLNEGYDPVSTEGTKKYDFYKQFSSYDQIGKRPRVDDLMSQMANIADAVKWLHGDLKVELIHMDLKPANILITSDFDPSAGGSSVGIWQVSDFGIAVQKPQHMAVTTLSDNLARFNHRKLDVSRTNRRRDRGTYQAPEIELDGDATMGKKSDVWSLACISAEVLAFAVGRRDHVHEFSKYRFDQRLENNWFYSPKAQDRLNIGKPTEFEVRPAAVEWLRNLGHDHEAWVKCYVNVILKALVVDMKSRPAAESFNEDLKHAADHCKRPAHYRGHSCTILRSGLPEQPLPATKTNAPSAVETTAPLSPSTSAPPAIQRTAPTATERTELSTASTSVPPADEMTNVRRASNSALAAVVTNAPSPSTTSPRTRTVPSNSTNSHTPPPTMASLSNFNTHDTHPPHRSSLSNATTQGSSGTSESLSDPGSSHHGLGLDSPSGYPEFPGRAQQTRNVQNPAMPRVIGSPPSHQGSWGADHRHRSYREKPPTPVDVAICPSGEHALWLFSNCMHFKNLYGQQDATRQNSAIDPQDSSLQNPRIPLQENVTWQTVHLAQNGYAGVQGKTNKQPEGIKKKLFGRSPSSSATEVGKKHFLFFDLRRTWLQMQVPDSEEVSLARVESMAISSTGFAVLKRTSKLLVYDLERYGPSSQDATGVEQDTSIELKKILHVEKITLPAGKRQSVNSGYHFSAIMFSPSGDALFAWCFGVDRTICRWYFDTSTRVIGEPSYFRLYTDQNAPREGIASLLMAPSPSPDLPDVCIVRDTHGAFLSVQLDRKPGKQRLYQTLVASASTQVELMGVHDHRYLIVVSKVKGTKHKVYKFPLDRGGSSRGRPQGVSVGDIHAFPDDCKMRIISQYDTLSILMLSHKHGVDRIWLDVN